MDLNLASAPVLELAEVGSTNTYARLVANEGHPPPPLVIVALRQTAGRGRGANRWFSDSGSLTFSVLIDPAPLSLRPDHWPRLALASAVAVVDTVEPFLSHSQAGIRWPNDVEVGDRKVAGLLPERLVTPFGPRLVLGIGLNVSTRFGQAPPEVRSLATSILQEAAPGHPLPDLASVRTLLLHHLSVRLVQLSCDAPELARRWQDLDTLRGRHVLIEQGPSEISGEGAGIREDGALLLQTESGIVPVFGGIVKREPPRWTGPGE